MTGQSSFLLSREMSGAQFLNPLRFHGGDQFQAAKDDKCMTVAEIAALSCQVGGCELQWLSNADRRSGQFAAAQTRHLVSVLVRRCFLEFCRCQTQ